MSYFKGFFKGRAPSSKKVSVSSKQSNNSSITKRGENSLFSKIGKKLSQFVNPTVGQKLWELQRFRILFRLYARAPQEIFNKKGFQAIHPAKVILDITKSELEDYQERSLNAPGIGWCPDLKTLVKFAQANAAFWSTRYLYVGIGFACDLTEAKIEIGGTEVSSFDSEKEQLTLQTVDLTNVLVCIAPKDFKRLGKGFPVDNLMAKILNDGSVPEKIEVQDLEGVKNILVWLVSNNCIQKAVEVVLQYAAGNSSIPLKRELTHLNKEEPELCNLLMEGVYNALKQESIVGIDASKVEEMLSEELPLVTNREKTKYP
ncbi:TPA: hypothetical protein F7068_17035 [Legionella pneumophila]|nr:hypothetical protein [Legionella pneumophila]